MAPVAKSSILNPQSKILAIVGPTASGKSELAVFLAKKFNGEIISADSRQVYRGMNIGTGKIQGRWYKKYPKSHIIYPIYIYKSIRHHCIDFVSPQKRYSVAKFKKQADKVIKDIFSRDKLPILCGGTAQYVDTVIYNQKIPAVKPNFKLRAKLEKQSADALYKKLMKLDKVRAEGIDRFNKRRLIRALEIVITTGKPVPSFGVIPTGAQGSLKLSSASDSSTQMHSLGMTNNKTLWLGIQTNQQTLYKKIEKRLKQRLNPPAGGGMIKEVSRLHSGSLPFSKGEVRRGLSWKKLESFGLEYKYISLYLEKKISYNEMFTQLLFAIKHYSKRQMTWWKRNGEINWVNNRNQAKKLIKNLL